MSGNINLCEQTGLIQSYITEELSDKNDSFIWEVNLELSFGPKSERNKGNTSVLSRRIDINVLIVALVVASLLCIAILSGCQEECSHENDLFKVDRIAY